MNKTHGKIKKTQVKIDKTHSKMFFTQIYTKTSFDPGFWFFKWLSLYLV